MSIQPNSPNSVIEKVFSTKKDQYQLRIYSPYPQFKIILFSKMRPKTDVLHIREVENLVNTTINRFRLNPHFVVWIDYDSSRIENQLDPVFSLVTFDWYYGKATNPRWTYIEKNWYIYWLNSLNFEYIDLWVHEM